MDDTGGAEVCWNARVAGAGMLEDVEILLVRSGLGIFVVGTGTSDDLTVMLNEDAGTLGWVSVV